MEISGRDKIRTGFLIFFVCLLIQYGLVGLVGYLHSEPWPAFTLPGFKNVYDRGEYIEQRVARFVAFSDHDSIYTLKPAQIFRDIPVSHHNGIMRYQFNPDRRPDKGKVMEMSPPGYNWLLHRVQQETGDEGIARVKVVWSWHRYQIRGEQKMERFEVPFDTLHVRLLSP